MMIRAKLEIPIVLIGDFEKGVGKAWWDPGEQAFLFEVIGGNYLTCRNLLDIAQILSHLNKGEDLDFSENGILTFPAPE